MRQLSPLFLSLTLSLACASESGSTPAPESQDDDGSTPAPHDAGCQKVPSFFFPTGQDAQSAVLASRTVVCERMAYGCFASLAEAEDFGREHADFFGGGCRFELQRGCGTTALLHLNSNPLQVWIYDDASGALVGASRYDDIGYEVEGCTWAEFAWGTPRPDCPDRTRESLCADEDAGL